jgi:hypothetical protein
VRSRRIGRGWEKALAKGTKRRAALEAFPAAERREGERERWGVTPGPATRPCDPALRRAALPGSDDWLPVGCLPIPLRSVSVCCSLRIDCKFALLDRPAVGVRAGQGFAVCLVLQDTYAVAPPQSQLGLGSFEQMTRVNQ